MQLTCSSIVPYSLHAAETGAQVDSLPLLCFSFMLSMCNERENLFFQSKKTFFLRTRICYACLTDKEMPCIGISTPSKIKDKQQITMKVQNNCLFSIVLFLSIPSPWLSETLGHPLCNSNTWSQPRLLSNVVSSVRVVTDWSLLHLLPIFFKDCTIWQLHVIWETIMGEIFLKESSWHVHYYQNKASSRKCSWTYWWSIFSNSLDVKDGTSCSLLTWGWHFLGSLWFSLIQDR